MEYITKDSGEREFFKTGAKRDTRKGKGRFDLISPIALKRLALVYERGSEKYDDDNWRKGMPHRRYIDSAIRHLNTYAENKIKGLPQDEDHLAQAAWNIFALIEMEEMRPDLDDFFRYPQEQLPFNDFDELLNL